MNFLKSNFSNMGIIYPRFRNMGITYPLFQYVGIILIYLLILLQHGHSMPTFKNS